MTDWLTLLILLPSILELGRPQTLATYELHDSISQFSFGEIEILLTEVSVYCC